jgi:crotonobetainyl-CoA:carnitine CoA-transferase CaiB-like acyl-CoA transferase
VGKSADSRPLVAAVILPPAPLSGVTVVESFSPYCPLALRLAGALAGRIAADLGARVVLLETPEGDPLRKMPPMTRAGDNAVFAFLAAGKQSVSDRPTMARRLLGQADAVLADTERADLPAAAPTCVLLSMLPQTDCLDRGAAWPQSEFTVMALGGLLDVVGDPAHPPLRLGGHQLAYAAGLAVYAGLVSGLMRRLSPEVARVALMDGAVWLNWKSAASVACLGMLSTRTGRAAELPVLRCADGYVALVYQATDWAALCRLCDAPVWTTRASAIRSAGGKTPSRWRTSSRPRSVV